MQLATTPTTYNIEIDASGNILANNFSSPSIYIDGVLNPTPTFPNDNEWHNITITTGTGINADNINIGRISTTHYLGLL